MSLAVTAVALLSLDWCDAAVVEGPPYETTWYTSRSSSNLSVSSDHVLTWGLESTDGLKSLRPATKTTVEAILTNLKQPVSLSSIGDSFNFTVSWLSTGTNKKACPASYYADEKYCLKNEKESCVSHTPECLSGTGDFRIAFFDTVSNKAGQVTSDNFAPTLDYQVMKTMMQQPPFVNWRGYNLHFFPHVSKSAQKYTPTDRGVAAPSSFCYRSSGDSSKEAWPFTNHKLGDTFGGFEIKEGEWQDLTFSVTRSGASAFDLMVSSNGLSYKQVHQWKSSEKAWMPQLVDSVGIIYPNERGYSHVQIKLAPGPPTPAPTPPSPGPPTPAPTPPSPAPAVAWSVVDAWNAIPDGKTTTEKSVAKCQAKCVGDCAQYSWNSKSGHCYLSQQLVWAGLSSDHITSGCDASRVSGCPGASQASVADAFVL